MSHELENTFKDNLTGEFTGDPDSNYPLKYLTASSIIGEPVRNREGEHLGKIKDIMLDIRQGKIEYYVIEFGAMDPDQFIYLKELCDLVEDYGRSRYWMVKLTGGDAGINPPHSPEFTIHLFNGRKCCRREAIATMRELAQQKP